MSTRLKRLRFRSWHRGTKETDLILGHYADAHLETMDEAALAVYERLLEEQDADIWDWLTGKADPPVEAYAPLIARLREYGRKPA